MQTILVVEDDENMRKSLRTMLETTGYNVLEAVNGSEAKAVYEREKPALVLMDIILPGEHGLDAIKEIIKFDSDARIVALSGIHHESLIMSTLDAGAMDFMAKPFTVEDMIEVIKKHTE